MGHVCHQIQNRVKAMEKHQSQQNLVRMMGQCSQNLARTIKMGQCHCHYQQKLVRKTNTTEPGQGGGTVTMSSKLGQDDGTEWLFTRTLSGWCNNIRKSQSGWWDNVRRGRSGWWKNVSRSRSSWWDSVSKTFTEWWDNVTSQQNLDRLTQWFQQNINIITTHPNFIMGGIN